jgi:hypothetical protein
MHLLALLARIGLLTWLAFLLVAQSFAQAPEQRFALVIGNSEYKAGRLPTGANDAGLRDAARRGVRCCRSSRS